MTESDLRTILGENLKKYRTLKGFSQAKLAEMLDLTPNFISDIETGKRWLSSDTMVNLASALNVEVYELIKPYEYPADKISDFIKTYTEKASKAASDAVSSSLENLRKQYIS
jgi:transcriptional regulator with XRE-family HTH domain